jgi:hypothetical protein
MHPGLPLVFELAKIASIFFQVTHHVRHLIDITLTLGQFVQMI